MDRNLFQNTTRGAFAGTLFACALAGCAPNPNGMGVADFGSVTGRIVDRQSLQAIPSALVSIGNLAATTDAGGAFLIAHVPVGTQVVHISAVGWEGTTVTVSVTKDQTTAIPDPIGLVSSLGT
jgi:hypothetical protein